MEENKETTITLTTEQVLDVFGCSRAIPSPNLEITINSKLPATKSKIKVGDTVLEGVHTCDIHIDADHEILYATLRVIVGKLHTE